MTNCNTTPKRVKNVTSKLNQKLEPQGALIAHLSTMSTSVNKLDSRVKNLTSEWNQKQQHFISHTSRSLLCIRFVAVAFQSVEEVF